MMSSFAAMVLCGLAGAPKGGAGAATPMLAQLVQPTLGVVARRETHPLVALAECSRHECQLEPQTGTDHAAHLLRQPPKNIVMSLGSKLPVDPALVAAAVWLASSHLILDIKS